MPPKPSPVERDEELEVLEDEEAVQRWLEKEPSPKQREHNGTSKKLLPPTDIGQEEALKLVGQMLDERHYSFLLDETATVGTPEGGPICVLLKNRIPKDLLDRVRPEIWVNGSLDRCGGDNLLLILLLISGDLRLFQALMNAEDNFKSSGPVENKRHTNAHQPSPPAQQQRIQSPLSARFSFSIVFASVFAP